MYWQSDHQYPIHILFCFWLGIIYYCRTLFMTWQFESPKNGPSVAILAIKLVGCKWKCSFWCIINFFRCRQSFHIRVTVRSLKSTLIISDIVQTEICVLVTELTLGVNKHSCHRKSRQLNGFHICLNEISYTLSWSHRNVIENPSNVFYLNECGVVFEVMPFIFFCFLRTTLVWNEQFQTDDWRNLYGALKFW